jgi:VWFA-related protein
MWRRTFAAAFAGAGIVAAAGSPDAAQQRVFRTAIDLVQVDVMVLDEAGRPVRGLQKLDFELLDQGTPRAIDVFVEFAAATPAATAPTLLARRDVVSNDDTRSDRLVVLVLDDLHIRWDSTDRARTAARRIVEQMGDHATVAVVLTSGDPGVEFTDDLAVVLAAIDRFEGRENPFEGRGGSWLIPRFDPSGRSGAPPDLKALSDSDRLLTTLADAANRLPRRDWRRKALVLVSEGLPGVAGVTDPAKSASGLPANGLYSSRDVFVGPRAKLIDAVRASGVSIYAIDPRGTTGVGSEGFSGSIEDASMREIDVAAGRRDSLDVLTGETGGYAVVNTNDLLAGADRIAQDLGSYYSLGFSPANPRSGRTREIAIRVRRPGLSVRHRRVYQFSTALTETEKAAAKDPLLGLVHSPVSSGDLPMRAWAAARLDERVQKDVAVALWLDTGEVSVGEYGIFVFDLERKRDVGQPIGRNLSGAVPGLLPLECPRLRPGTYQIRVAALARDPDRGGSVYVTLSVPDVSAAPVSLSDVVLGTNVLPRADLGTLPFAPTLERVFDRRVPIRLAFDVWRQPSAEGGTVSIDLIDDEGRLVNGTRDAVPAPGRSRFDLILPLDAAGAGAHTIRVIATAGGVATQRELALVLR